MNLESRLWHRLLKVCFYVCFVLALLLRSIDLMANSPELPQWRIVSLLNERVTTEVKQIRDLKRPGEQVEFKGGAEALNHKDATVRMDVQRLNEDPYCSNDLANKVRDVQNLSGIPNLLLHRNVTTIEALTQYIRDNRIQCLVPDQYSYADGTQYRFLEPISHSSWAGLVFYQPSLPLTLLFLAKQLLLVAGVFAGVVMAYYKIVLYIIFGAKA